MLPDWKKIYLILKPPPWIYQIRAWRRALDPTGTYRPETRCSPSSVLVVESANFWEFSWNCWEIWIVFVIVFFNLPTFCDSFWELLGLFRVERPKQPLKLLHGRRGYCRTSVFNHCCFQIWRDISFALFIELLAWFAVLLSKLFIALQNTSLVYSMGQNLSLLNKPSNSHASKDFWKWHP